MRSCRFVYLVEEFNILSYRDMEPLQPILDEQAKQDEKVMRESQLQYVRETNLIAFP